MTVTERAPLNRALIAETALSLIDERGLDQLSMRKLGAELGVEAMSLYNHVDNKDDLLDAVADRLYEHILDAYTEPDGPWRVRPPRWLSAMSRSRQCTPMRSRCWSVVRPSLAVSNVSRPGRRHLRRDHRRPPRRRPRLQCRGELGGRHARAAGKFGRNCRISLPTGNSPESRRSGGSCW